jgi:ribonuclease BN (tRNA processing enzyme)
MVELIGDISISIHEEIAMLKVTFLGTNGWFDSDTGNTISVFVDAGEFAVVLDAGNGLAKLDKYLEGRTVPVYIFLSHFHLDHIIGLHTLDGNIFPDGAVIMGQTGTRSTLDVIMRQPFTKPFSDMAFDVNIVELAATNTSCGFPFGIETLPLFHSSQCIGARLCIGDRVISYIPDTGYCENAVALSRGADLVIAECAYLPGHEDTAWPHLNPESAARIANTADAKKLALVHFDAKLYDTMSKRGRAEFVARSIFAESFAARDGMTVEV